MNNKELKRIKVMELLSRGSLTNQQAAELLWLGKRQIIRLKGKYLAYGDEGLIHGNKGRVSDKKISDENREKVIGLFNTKYFDFNFSHFTEKLNEQEGMDSSRTPFTLWHERLSIINISPSFKVGHKAFFSHCLKKSPVRESL